MRRFKYNISRYLLISVVWTVIFIISWICFVLWFVNFMREQNFADDRFILREIMWSNYNGQNLLTAFLPVIFVYSLEYLLGDSTPVTVLRFRSRGTFLGMCIFKAAVLSVIVAVLHELVNIIGLLIVFHPSLVFEVKMPLYSLVNILTLEIYYLRCGGLLLLFNNFKKEKLASVAVVAVYLFELFILSPVATGQYKLWLPNLDASVMYELMQGYIGWNDLMLIIARGVAMTGIVLLCAWFRFQKKDVLHYEKK